MKYEDYQIDSKIKNLVKKREISIKFLAEKIKMTESGLHSALKNNSVKIKTLHEISIILDVDISYFFKPIPDLQQLYNDIEQEKEVLLPYMELKNGIYEIFNQSKGFTETEANLISQTFKLAKIINENKEDNKKLTEKCSLYKKINNFNDKKIVNLYSTIKYLVYEVLLHSSELQNVNAYNNLYYFLEFYKDDLDNDTIERIKKLTKKNEHKLGKGYKEHPKL